jgi:oligopeptidase A
VLDATNAYAIRAGRSRAGRLPGDAIEAAREAAQKDGKEGWKFTLHFPSYFPVLQYAENRALRETMYRAYATRASELGPQYGGGKAEWDNTAIIADS